MRSCRGAILVVRVIAIQASALAVLTTTTAWAQGPVLNTVFPAGTQAGAAVDVVVEGAALDEPAGLIFSDRRLSAKKIDANRLAVTAPPDIPTGVYDVRVVGKLGVSSPRSFVVGTLKETREAEPNETPETASEAPLEGIVNGRIEKPADVDCLRFTAKTGQRVVLDCRAERIDSPLRAVLELYDAQGNRMTAERGTTGLDPWLDFVVPADGVYTAKIFDLTYSGGSTFAYRLEISTGPWVEFAVPPVVQQGKPARVTLYGRNLRPSGAPASRAQRSEAPFDAVDVEIVPPASADPAGLRLSSPQLALDAFAYRYPGTSAPLTLALTDLPVVRDAADNHSPQTAQPLDFPCEVGGQLTAGDEQDWFSVQVRKGDVLWLEAFGDRLGSPVDLDLVVLDPTGERELEHFTDCLDAPRAGGLPLNHLDPAGRWVAHADGRFLLMLRNLIGGTVADLRRVYRLTVRREEPDFRLALVPRRKDQPATLNVPRGGRELFEIVALRQRGFDRAIHVSSRDLPPGFDGADVWIGPGADRVPLVITATRDVEAKPFDLTLSGQADLAGAVLARPVRGGTVVVPGQPVPQGRLTPDLVLGTAAESPIRITAALEKSDVFQNGIFDVAVNVDRQAGAETGPVRLSVIGLPEVVEHEAVTLPATSQRGWISVFVPSSLPPGPYTVAIQAEAEVTVGKAKTMATAFSNTVTVQVEPARIVLELDPKSPTRIARGKIIQLAYTAERKHGFIGKIHTELTAPGGVIGLRARGVTFVGQTDSGSLQVIANDDAPLGRQPFLRLHAVGTVEDRPVYHAGRFVELEITE